MIKKIFCSLLFLWFFIFSAFAASSVFPASRTNINGNVEYGYLNESGQTVLPFAYYFASEFSDTGLAAVEDYNWQTAVINQSGELVVPYTDSPVSVEFGAQSIAYRYEDYSIYYTLSGDKIGSFAGARGFFSDGLLLCFDEAQERYSYVNLIGSHPFESSFLNAGAFSNGVAVVQKEDKTYAIINTEGAELSIIPGDLSPAYFTLYGNDTLVVTDGKYYGLYSISENTTANCMYTDISEFHNGFAIFRLGNSRGLLDLSGKEYQTAQYSFLSYLGDELYAARNSDGSCSVIDADGNLIYRATTYVGGFTPLKHGLSWHGMLDGSVVFFNKTGGYFASLQNAENPVFLTENVVRVTQNEKTTYINLATGKTVYTPPTTFSLGQDIKITSVSYQKFLGYQTNGEEYGWNVTFPELSGMIDTDIQKSINSSIRDFFLKGPSVTAEYYAMEGGFGASIEGSVLVVYANCISGKGKGASVWNNSIAFDLTTGKQYKVSNLFIKGYEQTLRDILPADHSFHQYTFPRISSKGITYFYNEYESNTRRAYTTEYPLSFEELREIINMESDCYKALKTPYQKPTLAAFDDVPLNHWAAGYIQKVSEENLMIGYNRLFRPEEKITSAEVCTTIARKQQLPETSLLMPGINPSAWYIKEVSATYEYGLLSGLEDSFAPDYAISREDAMQIFANILEKQGKTLSGNPETILSKFSDAANLDAERISAAALCVEQNLIEGSNGTLLPKDNFSRAEFAKLLTLI